MAFFICNYILSYFDKDLIVFVLKYILCLLIEINVYIYIYKIKENFDFLIIIKLVCLN